MSANVDMNQRPDPDQVLVDIADYVDGYEITSDEHYGVYLQDQDTDGKPELYSVELDSDADTVVTFEFTAPSGRVRRQEAFRDGGERWRVRFMPDEPGEWRYRSRSRPPAAGLDGSGELHHRVTGRRRGGLREGQLTALLSSRPDAVLASSLTGLVPALHDVGDRAQGQEIVLAPTEAGR